jgi:hypothetical protein
MHDLDRALQELEADGNEMEAEAYEFGEEMEEESDYEGESEADYEANYESEYDLAQESEAAGDYEAVFDELEEMEQAAALLEVQDEGELDQFLGGFLDKVKKKLRAALPPQVQKALTDTLKKVAKKALPTGAAALGNLIAPGVGGAIAGRVAGGATKMFGLELEGMSYEDQQFEVARRVVGLGAEATKAASQAVQAGIGQPPAQIAKDAVLQAAQTHAPGLASGLLAGGGVDSRSSSMGRGFGRSGRWYRRGRRIVIVGV